MERLLRISSASRILGVSISTLRQWEKEGKIGYKYFVEFFKALGVEGVKK